MKRIASPFIPFHRLTRWLWALTLAFGLTGCGFHLMGNQWGQTRPENDHATASVQLQGDTGNLVAQAMGESRFNTLPLVKENGHLTLDMGEFSTHKTVLSKTNNGTISEYRLTQSIVVQILDANKQVLLAPTRLSTQRNLIVGRGYATTEIAEQQRLHLDMAQELANALYYRLQAAWANRPATAQTTPQTSP